jgi:hypothetical protein
MNHRFYQFALFLLMSLLLVRCVDDETEISTTKTDL